MAAISPDKPRSLHNFSLPPRLRWGAQRLLRCSNADSDTASGSPSSSKRRRPLNNSPENRLNSPPAKAAIGGGSDRIEAVRQKLMIDLRSEVDKIKNAILAEGGDCDRRRKPPPETEPRSWNLRTRRAACGETKADGGGDVRFFPLAARSGGGGVAKLTVALSREEIEEDFVALTRRRPARKPRKRARCVQKQLDTLFPGLWLSEITTDMYEVIDNP